MKENQRLGFQTGLRNNDSPDTDHHGAQDNNGTSRPASNGLRRIQILVQQTMTRHLTNWAQNIILAEDYRSQYYHQVLERNSRVGSMGLP